MIKKIVAGTLLGVFACVALIAVFGSNAERAPNRLLLQHNEHNIELWIVNAFEKWATKYNKIYLTAAEAVHRLKIFRDNLYLIKKITEEEHSFTLAVNEFADLTQEEFAARYLGAKKPRKEQTQTSYLDTNSIPDAVDWRNKSAVTPVKNQGQCGSCWAFSTTGALEGVIAVKTGELLSFSEQQLVDCSGTYGNEGCNGGLMTQAFSYVADNGIEQEDAYPYKALDGRCKYDQTIVTHTVNGYREVPQNDEDQLAAAIAQQPVSVAIEADKPVFQFYSGGIIDSKACGTDLDHGVLAVGYGTDSTTGKQYYIVKNSWGGSWGERGYVRIARNAGKGTGVCGIAMDASYPTVYC